MIELTLEHQHKEEQHSAIEERRSSEEDEDESHMTHLPCHPHRPVHNFDFTAIEDQIKIIRRRKEEAKEAARRAKKVVKNKDQIYETDVIEQALQESMDMIPENISMALKQRIKFIQDKVYISSQNNSFGSIIQRIKDQVLSNESLANELNLVMSEVQVSIENDIEEGNFDIHPIVRKPKISSFEPEPAHRVKLKNMLIRNKLTDLKEEFNRSQVASDSPLITASVDTSSIKAQRKEGEIWGDEFHILSEGTKKAQEFVKQIKKEQRVLVQQKHRKAQDMKSLEVKSAMEHKEFEQEMKKERHQTLKQRYLEGREHKKVEKQKQEEKEKEFLSYIKEYKGKKPLFRVKEEQYLHNVVEEQLKRRKLHIQENHEAKKSITRKQIDQHETNYKKLKEEKMAHHHEEREFKKKEEASLPKRNYYRGKFHSAMKLEEEEKKNIVDPVVGRDELLKKQKDFGEFVRKKYISHIDEGKRKQLETMMLSLESQGGKKGLSQDEYKKLGNEYLKQMHKMVAELREKGLLKSKVIEEEAPKRKDYMKQVRNRYSFDTIDFSSQAESNPQWVQNAGAKREKDARHKQKVMKHNNQFDLDKYMSELHSINDDYIYSAEAKMSLIKQLEHSGRRSGTSRLSEGY